MNASEVQPALTSTILRQRAEAMIVPLRLDLKRSTAGAETQTHARKTDLRFWDKRALVVVQKFIFKVIQDRLYYSKPLKRTRASPSPTCFLTLLFFLNSHIFKVEFYSVLNICI
jgi:hypothetical protein